MLSLSAQRYTGAIRRVTGHSSMRCGHSQAKNREPTARRTADGTRKIRKTNLSSSSASNVVAQRGNVSFSTNRRPYRPPWLRALNAGDRTLRAMGVRLAAVSESSLRSRAVRRTGYDDFGDESFAKGLRLLVGAFQKNPRLTLVGRFFVRDALLRRLENRLLIEATIRNEPAIAQQSMERPIFILGLPRTGSTLLHRLLAVDPNNRVPQTWEMQRPVPPPESSTYLTDPRIALIEKDYALLNRLAPTFQAIHEIGAQLPEECIELFANSFASEWFSVGLELPEYAQWLYGTDLSSTYEYHRRQLQILQ